MRGEGGRRGDELDWKENAFKYKENKFNKST